MRSSYILVAGVALLHLAVSGLLLLVGAGASLTALESGVRQPILAQVSSLAGRVLLFPVFIPGSEWLSRSSGAVGWALLILNSLVWGAAFYGLLRVLRSRRSRRIHTA